jgi:hypothetical protein
LGRKPLVVHADNADQILALLRLTGQIEQSVKRIIAASNQNPSPVFTGIRLIIAGGAEAWLVAEQMRKHNVSGVLLYPVNCYPEHHDSRRCRSLSSLENPILLKISKRNGTHYTPPVSGLSILRRHGIKVAIAAESNNMVHDLYFDAGWAEWLSDRRIDGSAIQPEANYTRISPHDAVGMISWRVAEMFGISDFYAAQTFTNFVIFAGDHPMKSVKTAVGLAVNQISTDSWLIRCMPNQL